MSNQQTEFVLQNGIRSRQVEIVRLLSQDMDTKEIAAKLEISPRTIEAHIDRMKLQVGVRTRAGLVGLMLRKKLIS